LTGETRLRFWALAGQPRLRYQLTGNRQYHGSVTAVPTTRAQHTHHDGRAGLLSTRRQGLLRKILRRNHVDSKNFMPDENCKNVIKEAMSLIDAASSEEELRKTWKFIESFRGIYEMHIRKSGFDEIREYKENKSQELKKTTEGEKVDMTV
ncbi:hypothetical protein NQ028_12655, partial [Corynebacterium phoceense]|uniref:hypothetical protein n=1 Tax=Corynebacterium phoceense TaxID=1686286 RepID=UPI00211C3D00